MLSLSLSVLALPPCLLLSCCTGRRTLLIVGVGPRQTAWWVTPIADLPVAAIQVTAHAPPVSSEACGPIANITVPFVMVVALWAKPIT